VRHGFFGLRLHDVLRQRVSIACIVRAHYAPRP
jgi:hypothetical protein